MNGEKPRAARGFIGLLVRLDRALLPSPPLSTYALATGTSSAAM
jgi:hypothetical protein